MSTTTKVSVCIPIYNVAAYIERCARALFEQTMQEGIEFIFVNDCTPDQSLEILERVLSDYPHRKACVKIIHHKKNQGLSVARQTALKHASGTYIIHCDSDDWVDRDYYEAMYRTAAATQADIVYSSYVQDDGKDSQVLTTIAAYSTPMALLNGILGNNLHWNVWAKLVHRRLALATDVVVLPEVCFGEDLLLSAQLIAKASTVAYCADSKYHYFCKNETSYTRTFSRKSLNQLMCALKTLQRVLPVTAAMSGCKGEILFKAVFYHLMTPKEFKSYARGSRSEILKTSTFSRIKRLILLYAFISYRLAAWTCKVLRKLR